MEAEDRAVWRFSRSAPLDALLFGEGVMVSLWVRSGLLELERDWPSLTLAESVGSSQGARGVSPGSIGCGTW